MISVLFVYFLAMNVIAFFLFGIDKYKAKHAQWRIPEMTLLGTAVVGGSFGAIMGMNVWHHKTKHKKFVIGLPAIILCQVVILALLFLY